MSIKKSLVYTAYSDEPVGCRFEVERAGSFDLLFADLIENIRMRAMAHGIFQKVGDAAALSNGATDAQKLDAMTIVANQLLDGQWNVKREGAGTLLVRAVSEWSGQDVATVRAQMADLPAATLRQVAEGHEIAAIIKRLEAERPVPEAAKTAASAFLAGLRQK